MMSNRKYPMVKTSGWGFGWTESKKDRHIRELEEQVNKLSAELKALRQAMREAVRA